MCTGPTFGQRRARHARGLCLATMLCLSVAAQSGTLNVSIVDQSGHAVEDAVVAVSAVDARAARPAGDTDGVIDQINKTFVPYVTAVRVGTLVRFPNSDNIHHHVYSFSPPKRFELPLYAGKSAAPVLFDKPGIVVMGCNIHDWMVGYVFVSDTPYFGKSEAKGVVQLRDLPAGEYLVRVWHPDMDNPEQPALRSIRVEDQNVVDSNWTIALHPSFRPRRAPVPTRSGY